MKPIKSIAVTGAAGQIAYSLLFRIASGQMCGADQPISLRCVDIGPAMKTMQGVAMELDDCVHPLLKEIIVTDNLAVAYDNVDYVLLVGAKPRGPGMERNDLLLENADIFTEHGKALNDYAKSDVKVLVIGNPANTNAMLTIKSAPRINPKNFTALTRLDHNRAISQLAKKTSAAITDVKKITVWGNHSATQYPDISHSYVAGKKTTELVDEEWITKYFIPTVAKRGAAVIAARGLSSASSAAKAIVDHMYDWIFGTPKDDWTSMAVISDGSYGIEKGLVYSFPVTCRDGDYEIVQGLEISEFSRKYMKITEQELREERLMVNKII